MAQYSMTIQNASTNPWHLAIYQSFPESPGLSSVAWQIVQLPAQNVGTPPPQGTATWTMSYGTSIADFDQVNGVYTGQAYANANLGNKYQVITVDNIPTIKPNPVGQTTKDQIILTNGTSPATAVTMGFTLSNNIVTAEQNVGGNQSTIFRVHPTYYVAGYRSIKFGQLVDEGVSIPPIEVKYEDGVFEHQVQVVEDAGNTYLQLVK